MLNQGEKNPTTFYKTP